MKVIDLLNKIANGEEVPEKIKYNGEIYHYGYHFQWYLTDNLCKELFIDKNHLNDEIEIIEDTPKDTKQTPNSIRKSIGLPPKEDKKIEKVDFFELRENNKAGISNDTYLACFINEIIDKVNGE